MKTNQISRLLKHGTHSLVLIGIAVLGLAVITPDTASAQPVRFRQLQFTNTSIGTTYFQTGGSNVNQGEGIYLYQGGTNSVTLTNAQTIYAATSAVPFSLQSLQDTPVWWTIAAHAANTGTSNLVLQLDLTPDGTWWVSNALTATLALNGTNTSLTNLYFPFANGTNAFSGNMWGRWSYASTAQTNNVTLDQNQLLLRR